MGILEVTKKNSVGDNQLKFKFLLGLLYFLAATNSAFSENIAQKSQTEKIGYCVGVFGYGMNAYALANNAGGVRLLSLQYGRAYVTYGALTLNNGGVERAKQINNELYNYGQLARANLIANAQSINVEVNNCMNIINPVMHKLSNAGVKLDKGYSETLEETAAYIAASIRKDLGF